MSREMRIRQFKYDWHLAKDVVVEEKILTGDDNSIFNQFYKLQRSLRYCNGYYWKFEDEEIRKQYNKWVKENETIEMFYGGNVYD